MLATKIGSATEHPNDSLPFLIIGAGGHAKVVLDLLLASGCTVVGMLDVDPQSLGRQILGHPVLAEDITLAAHLPGTVLLANGVGGIGHTEQRRRVFERMVTQGYVFPALIHPTAIIARDVMVEDSAQVMAGAVIQTGAHIGHNSIVNTRAIIDHDCQIGGNCHIAPGATLSGSVRLGDGAHVGTGACVIQGIHIGAHACVGAGAVVIRDVASHSVVTGVPAHRRDSDQGTIE